MRENFAQHHIENHITFVTSSVPNILQYNIQQKEEDNKDEDLTTTHDVLELPTARVTTISENESKGNAISATVTQGEHNFDAQDLSTVHAIIEQSLVKYSPVLPLSQDHGLAIIYDNEGLCDSSLFNFMPQLNHDSNALYLNLKFPLKITTSF